MIMAQPRATYDQVVPNADVALQSLVVMFCNSVSDVSRAHTLVVNRSRYVAGMKRRIRVCPTFADVVLDPTQLREQLPEEESVPPAFVQAAVPMPEIRHLNTTRDGPATRRDQFGPAPEESQSDAPSSEGAAADAAGADTPAAGDPPSTEATSDAPGKARGKGYAVVVNDTPAATPAAMYPRLPPRLVPIMPMPAAIKPRLPSSAFSR